MKKRSSILWWLRRRKRPVVVINNEQVPTKDEIDNKVDTNLTNENKNEQVNEKEQIKEPKNTTMSPISIIPDPIEKEHDRELPIKDNERVTLIKPKRNIGIENTIEIKKQELNLEEEKVEEEKINKDFVNEETLDNDTVIITNTLDEIERMLKTNYHEIRNIQYELEVLEQKEEDEVLLEEVEKLIDELNKLIKKFEEIKKDFYEKNFEDIYKHSTNDNYIGQLIEEYKTSLKENNVGEATLLQVKQIEEYITLINDIIDIEKDKDKLDKNLNDKKDKFEIRDDEFEELKEKSADVEKMNDYIERFSNEYDTIIKDIESKVKEAAKITKHAEYRTELAVNYARLLTSTLLLGTSTAIPFNRGGNLLKMGLMIAGIAGLASAVRVRTRETNVVTRVSFIDYQKDILSNINSVQDMSLMIDKAMVDIKDIRNEFQKELGEYVNLIPEYYELLTNLDSIEKDLLVKQDIAKEYDKKLEEALEQNNVKVKRLEEEFPN